MRGFSLYSSSADSFHKWASVVFCSEVLGCNNASNDENAPEDLKEDDMNDA